LCQFLNRFGDVVTAAAAAAVVVVAAAEVEVVVVAVVVHARQVCWLSASVKEPEHFPYLKQNICYKELTFLGENTVNV
jgi:hypothetical protein